MFFFEIEQKIIKQFSDIPAVENPKERFLVEIPDNEEMLFTVAMDEEVTTSNISFSINHPRSLADQTVKDLKESLINKFESIVADIGYFLGKKNQYDLCY